MAIESETRKATIDQRLKDAGWDVSDQTQVVSEFFVACFDSNVLRDDPAIRGTREFSDYAVTRRDQDV